MLASVEQLIHQDRYANRAEVVREGVALSSIGSGVGSSARPSAVATSGSRKATKRWPSPGLAHCGPSETSLGDVPRPEGLPSGRVASFDNVLTFPLSMLTQRAGGLTAGPLPEICDAAGWALDCSPREGR